MKNFWLATTLCVLLVGTTSNYVDAQPANAPATNSFTGSLSVPDGANFTLTGSMNVARSSHTATLLNDGSGRVLVTGGFNGSSALASAELYDTVAGTWSPTGNMNVARGSSNPATWLSGSHTATLLNSGKVLVAGGYNGSYLASAELYDPVAGTWSLTGDMSSVHAYHTATLLNSGKVFVAGGYNGSYLAIAELYDPSAGTWSPTGMNVGRWRHTATLLNNGKVLIAGGDNRRY